jgi:hypothetical protein
MRHHRFPRFLSFFILAVLAAFSLTACQRSEKTAAPAPVSEKAAAPPAEELTLETLSSVLGKAEAENSGLFELTRGENEWIVTYHFYEARTKGMEERFGPDLAPKIQALYKKFKTIDRVMFKVDVFARRDAVEWRPYCSFVTTRKLIDETNWTNLLLKDFFKVVLELKYID